MDKNTVRTKWDEFISDLTRTLKYFSTDRIESLLETIFDKYEEDNRYLILLHNL